MKHKLKDEQVELPTIPDTDFHLSQPFKRELEHLINKYSQENGSDTPDFILAEYLTECLHTFDRMVNRREEWYGRQKSI